MPSVTMASVSAENSMASVMAVLKASMSATTWSLGVTTMFARGLIFLMRQLT